MKILRGRSGPRTLIGLMAALGLVAALTMPALANHDVAGPAVSATEEAFPGGNPVCPEGTTGVRFDQNELAVDAVKGGVKITAVDVGAGTLSFEVTDPATVVVKVFMKGSEPQNVYDYSALPGGGVAHDDGLVTPNNSSGGPAGISHVDFCLGAATAGESQPAESQPAESEPAESQPAESQPAESEEPEESELPSEESEQPAQSIREDTQGGNPTATPTGGSLPNTAMGDLSQVPATVLSLVLLGALAAMVYVRLARQR